MKIQLKHLYWYIIGIFIVVISILYYKKYTLPSVPLTEGFQSSSQNVIINGKKVYDDFYSEIYDQLFQSDLRTEYECLQINKMFLKQWDGKVRLLDLGCGTGHHLRILKRYGYDVEGVDQSVQMIRKARKQCPKAKLKVGNFDDHNIYPKRSFTHISCMFFTFYYSQSYKKFFWNANYWLQPKGLLFLHVVQKEKFDPVLERASSLIPLFDPQKHSDKRKTETRLAFKEFEYTSDWDFQKKRVVFRETINYTNEPFTREHVHNFKMLDPKKIILLANKNGFELIKSIDLFIVGHNHNFIFVFRKRYGT